MEPLGRGVRIICLQKQKSELRHLIQFQTLNLSSFSLNIKKKTKGETSLLLQMQMSQNQLFRFLRLTRLQTALKRLELLAIYLQKFKETLAFINSVVSSGTRDPKVWIRSCLLCHSYSY